MKRLSVVGMNGVKLAECLVDMVGENYQVNFQLPIFLPIVNISITELPDEDTKKIKALIEGLKAITDVKVKDNLTRLLRQ